MRSDFIEYAGKEWSAEKNIHIIYAGKEKETTKPIVISTWQSVYELPEKTFADYDAVIGDEKMPSLQSKVIGQTNEQAQKLSHSRWYYWYIR